MTGREAQGAGELRIEQSAGELTSVRDSAHAELSAVDEYLTELNDTCVVKAMTYEEKPQTHVVEIAGIKEALSILSESTLLQWRQTLQRATQP